MRLVRFSLKLAAFRIMCQSAPYKTRSRSAQYERPRAQKQILHSACAANPAPSRQDLVQVVHCPCFLNHGKVIRDEAEAWILRLELEPGRMEWVAFSPRTNGLNLNTIETSEPMIYLKCTQP